ncbi:MAG TPA: PAS domain-containing protein, partial [Luteitalea sp.]|nr:PAS domain-containing protein [Luteitalea sp.]
DLDGVISTWNAGAARLYGWTAEQARGSVSHDLLHTQPIELDATPNESVLGLGLWEGRLSQRRADGRAVIVQARWAVRTGPDGNPVVCELARDVTEKVRAQEAAAQADSIERRLEFVVDACDIGTWYSALIPLDDAPPSAEVLNFGMQSGELTISDVCRHHLGLPPGTAIDAAAINARIYPEDRAGVADAMAAAIASGGEYDATFRTWLPHDDGIRWVRGIGRVAFDDRGTAVRFDGITLDVTGEKHLEHVLRERESWFRALADDVPVALWQTDPAQAWVYVSRQWREFTGSTLASNLGDGWLVHVHPDDRAGLVATLLEAGQRREPFAVDYRLRRHDGVYRWAATLGMPRTAELGRHEGFVGCVIDVHERKRAELALIEDDRRKDEFLAVLAHELRNPLAPIRTVVHLLGHERATPEVSRRALPMLQRQLVHLVRLVDDLLDVTRIRTGKLALRRMPTIVQDVVAQAVEASGLSASSSPQLTVRQPAMPITVDGDATRLVQALMNLLNNAAKFTPAGGEVSLEVAHDEGEVVVTVRDSGIGMDAEFLPRVFDLFVQAAAPQDHGRSGLGIGLTLVRSLVELHGGRVRAWSDGHGHGSTFEIALPTM